MAEQERPSVRRRSSVGRALDRVKDALKRRRSSAAATATLQSTREEEGTAATPAAAEQASTAPAEETKQDEATVTEPKVAEPGESIADSQLVPDDASDDDVHGNEELLTPLFSSRMGFSDDKAKALFDRYGIKYQPRQPAPAGTSTSASKIRRVERPVRIRIHWTCHECNRQFGHDRACLHCGHRRCSDCTRAPPKRVKAVLDEAKQMQMAEERKEANKGQILAAISPNTVAEPARPETAADPTLELAVDEDEETDGAQYTIEQRPRAGITLVMRSKAPTKRRVCHECQTPFLSKSRTECGKCGHQRCNSCPVRTISTAGEGEAPFEPKMIATVQRVYRKPRQRVRWQCDRCETIFADNHRCRVCDHERCDSCTRSPLKRIPVEPDPAVVQSLADKLDAWQRERSRAFESTTTPLEPEPALS